MPFRRSTMMPYNVCGITETLTILLLVCRKILSRKST